MYPSLLVFTYTSRCALRRFVDTYMLAYTFQFRSLDRCDTFEQAIGSRQFRFKDVGSSSSAGDGSTAPLFELEHETRALSHSSFMKPIAFEFDKN